MSAEEFQGSMSIQPGGSSDISGRPTGAYTGEPEVAFDGGAVEPTSPVSEIDRLQQEVADLDQRISLIVARGGDPRALESQRDRKLSQIETQTTAATAAEENRLVSEDAARQARYNRNVIGGILNDPALSSIVGRIEGQTQPGTIAGAALFGEDQLNLLAKIDQLEGQVFLEARDMLRGGGQITDFEGRRAQTALSRIGQRGVSEEAYRQALTELDQVFANSEARALGQPVPFPEIDTDPDAENTSAASAPRASGGDIPQITSDAEYDALPSGAQFMAPDGTIRRKP